MPLNHVGMPNAPLSALHVVNMILASNRGEDWHEEEREAIEMNAIPRQYVISTERIDKALAMEKVEVESAYNRTIYSTM
jgi:hypothetical protein